MIPIPIWKLYPNKLISIEEVGTDPYLAQGYTEYPGFLDWLQNWFAQGEQAAIF